MENEGGAQKTEQPVAMGITRIRDEAKDIRTFRFNHSVNAKPGQFIMLWIPRKNLKPFGVSKQDKKGFEITVCKVGAFTEELFKKKPGDYVGIQGPYGEPFRTDRENAVLVAGGYGSAPLAFLADTLADAGKKVTFIIGARTKESFPYAGRYKNSRVALIGTTDDGSFGKKGFATDALKQVLDDDKTVDMIYTCGPEIMMKRVVVLADQYGLDCELSLERYIKCGFGVCGQCCVDDTGRRLCKEGPVVSKEVAKKILEFGVYHRDASGKKVFQ